MSKIMEYFLTPKAEEYTISKTFVYSIFFLAIIYLLYILVKRFRIRIDEKFLLSFLPYILLGSTIRVLEDYSIISGIIFVTPWIQVIFIIPFVVFILLCTKIKQETLQKTFMIISYIFLGISLSFLPFKNINAVILHSLSTLLLLIIVKRIKTPILNKSLNKILLFSICFEFIITIINVEIFDFYEQHVLTRYMLENFPPLYPIARLFFVFLLIKILDVYHENKPMNNYIKIVFSVISLMIGARNMLQAIACC